MNKSPIKNNFPVCRACLSFDIKIHTLGPQLEKVFEKLTDIKLSSEDGKPRTVCYICFSLLKRCLRFANTSQISEGVLTEMLLNNSMLTKESLTFHKDELKNNFYTTPVVTCTLAPNKKKYKSVTVKTEVTDDEENNEMSDLNMEQDTELTMLEKEQDIEYDNHKNLHEPSVGQQLIIVGNKIQTCEKEQSLIDLELVISNVAQEIEYEQNFLEDEQEITENEQEITEIEQEITENEQDITENEQEITETEQEIMENEVVIKNKQHVLNKQEILDYEEEISDYEQEISDYEQEPSNNEHEIIKDQVSQLTDENSIVKQSNNNIEKENKIDSLISKLTQDIEDGFNALNNESSREDMITEPEIISSNVQESSDECILILSDDEMPECNDQTILIDDDDDDLVKNTEDRESRPVTYLNKPSVEIDKTKYYVCNLCGKSYKKSCLLRMHMRVHNSKGKLKPQVWTIINVKEKIYSCEICNDRFERKCSLVLHSKIHTRAYHFICEVCDKSYSCKRSLNVHNATTVHKRKLLHAEARRNKTGQVGVGLAQVSAPSNKI